jgi:hypothetical protein
LSSIVLIQSTQGFIDFIGDSVQAGGYFGFSDSLYTVAISTQNFIGNLYIEASLVTNPGLTDWFPVQVGASSNFLQYPAQPTAPTGLNGGDTGTLAYSFRGNFLFLRARVDRSSLYTYTPLDPYFISLLGTVRVVLSRSETVKPVSAFLPGNLPPTLPNPINFAPPPNIVVSPPAAFTIPGLVNIGDGYEIYAGIAGQNTAQLRSLVAGQGIAITEDTDSLTFNVIGSSSNSLSNTTSFADAFTQLSDVPATYVGAAGYVVTVNISQNGLTFTSLPPLALTGSITDAVGILSSSNGGTGLVAPAENSILIGLSASSLGTIQVPLVSNSILTWNGNQYEWIELPTLAVSNDLDIETLIVANNTVLSGSINLSGTIEISGDISFSNPLDLGNGGTSITLDISDDSSNIATTAFVNSLITAEISNLVERENNLSDLTNITIARENLGLGQAAILNVGDISGTLADAGDMIARDAAVLAEAQTYLSSAPISEISLENAFEIYGVSGGEYY